MDFREIKEFLTDAFKYILTAVVVLFIVIYIITLQQVVGPSMNPTLTNDDVLILNKAHYKFFAVKRFDIIAFQYDDTKYLIKRVIGLPGEVIEYKDNNLYVDDKIVEEPYLKGVTTKNFLLSDLDYNTIPNNMYLVLGDNRSNSLDSREIGLINKKDITGKVILKMWPLNGLKFY